MSGKGLFDEAPGATPLSPEEREGLIPSHITLRHELNEFEQQNILKGRMWALGRKHDPIAEAFGRSLHKRLFGDVWKWAGRYRQANKNIGVDKTLIHMHLAEQLNNFRYWTETRRLHRRKWPCGSITRSSSSIRFAMAMAAGREQWLTFSWHG